MAKGKTKLSKALVAQTARLHTNAQHREREQRAKLAASKPSLANKSARKNSVAQRSKAQSGVVPFSATDRVLLVGEGDFSFALALVSDSALAIVPENVIATTLDNEDLLREKYPETVGKNIEALRHRGVQVLCGVDATKLEACKSLKARTFDKIVWNFPHVGKGISDQDRNIRENQQVLLAFLAKVSSFIRKRRRSENADDNIEDDEEDHNPTDTSPSRSGTRGTVLITLRDALPYTLWDLPRLAKRPPNPENPRYVLLRSFAFARNHWRDLGYSHLHDQGHVDGIAVGQSGEERTWELAVADPEDDDTWNVKAKQIRSSSKWSRS
ncbi:hypothetical protein BKA62DRAFT_784672 [Auriculariales sp. MPI-PUGE-AT-0066]|nr:hypothetical protein BKA62DRAFT_784672 [Auriculariales sp. MPI-PUGE-AT-0066]